MQRANTQSTLLLVTMGWILVIVIIVLRQALRAFKSLTDKEQGDNLCISTPRKMFIVPISRGFLNCPNIY
jgi:hypothetical protein